MKHQIVIVGGGTAGITVAATLRRKPGGKSLDIAIIEPANSHYYQPAFTLVGGGAYALADTRRREQDLIPSGVKLIKDKVTGFAPGDNQVKLGSGESVSYDYLVVCAGLDLIWEKIEGLTATLGKNGVCSNYSPKYVEYTWQCIQGLQPGARALFTQAPLPFKCPGAPQKIAYLAADYLRKKGMLDQCEVRFLTHAPVMFGVPLFSKEMDKVVAKYGIQAHFQHNLVAVDSAGKKATFEIVGGDRKGEKVILPFDMLHVTPPQLPPPVVRSGPLANEAGFVDVHQHSMQHKKYSNVFGLGDACSTPNSKTAAAIRKQAPVVVHNLLILINGGKLEEGYDGYASCPLVTAYG
ncbi:MAG: FAD-dependent oxidoreductase, partial [Gammaproteobacteria bacterium]